MTKTAIAAPDHDPRPIRMLVLEDAIRRAIDKLNDCVGDVAALQASDILRDALTDRRGEVA
jgi:hypothetical protein